MQFFNGRTQLIQTQFWYTTLYYLFYLFDKFMTLIKYDLINIFFAPVLCVINYAVLVAVLKSKLIILEYWL